MRDNLVSAVFDNRTDAERAVTQLRSAGISDSQISIIAQDGGDKAVTTDGAGEETAKDVIGKANSAWCRNLLESRAAHSGRLPLVAAGCDREHRDSGAA